MIGKMNVNDLANMYKDKMDENFELLKQIKKLKAENEKLRGKCYQAIGWMYAEACTSLDNGEDIRTKEFPEIVNRLEKQLEGEK